MYCTLASTSIIHRITVIPKSTLMLATLAGLCRSEPKQEPMGSLYFFFFYHLPSVFSGKVAVLSSLEGKINRLVIHKNVNATLVPLGTSVCVVWDHSGSSMQLWTCYKCPHCFHIFNIPGQICSVNFHTHTHTKTHMQAYLIPHFHESIHAQKCAHTHDRPCSTQRTCHVSWRQGSDTVWCVWGLYRLGKGLKILPRLQWGQQ